MILATGGLQWGDVGTWVGSVAVSFASAVALMIYASSVGDRHRTQARLVTGAIRGDGALVPAGQLFPGTHQSSAYPRIVYEIQVINRSNEVILDLLVGMADRNGRQLQLGSGQWDLHPGEVWTRTVPVRDDGQRGGERLTLEFNDALGRRWRSHSGRITRVRFRSRGGTPGRRFT